VDGRPFTTGNNFLLCGKLDSGGLIKSTPSPQRSPVVRVCEPKRARVGGSMPWNKVIWWVILLVSGLMAYVAYVTYLQLAPMD
jgi:hypothetical protein